MSDGSIVAKPCGAYMHYNKGGLASVASAKVGLPRR